VGEYHILLVVFVLGMTFSLFRIQYLFWHIENEFFSIGIVN
jgi:hypothetical protein